MKRLLVMMVVIGGILVVLGSKVFAQEVKELTDPVEEQILNATIQIVLIAPADQNQQAVAERGLGTITTNSGGVLIITHDHWGILMDTAVTAQIRTAENQLLLEITGAELRNAILYQDGGTMVLKAPPGLLAERSSIRAASLGDKKLVGLGDTVHIVHQLAGKDHQIGVMEAIVDSSSGKDQRPVYILRSVDGQSIIPGDSGGGVWLNGELQGNMWTTVMIRELHMSSGEEREVPTDTCVAAIHLKTVHSLGTTPELLAEETVTRLNGISTQ